jgi:hypothetical protein
MQVVLPEYPITSIDAVRVMQGNVELEEVPEEKWYLSESGVLTIFDQVFPSKPMNLSIDFTYGHSSVPASLKLAAYELVTYFSKREFNKSRNIGGGETAQFADANVVPQHIRASLDLFRVL